MAQAVSHQLLTAKARIPARVLWDFVVNKMALGKGFFFEFFGYPLSISFHPSSSYISSGGWTIGQLVAAVQRHSSST
jgi:hypothetical protein